MMRQAAMILMLSFACMAATAQEVGGGNNTTDAQEVRQPANEAGTYNAIKTIKEYTPEEYAASRPTMEYQTDSLHLPTFNYLGQVWSTRMPFFRPGWSTWDLHQGLNVSLGASVFAEFGKHAHHGTGFGQSISAMYATPLTPKLSLAAGGYFNNLYWDHSAFRSAGVTAVMGYQFNEHWEAYLFGQKSIVEDRFIPYPLYDLGNLGDRIGVSVRYNVTPSFRLEMSVQHSTMPHLPPFHDPNMQRQQEKKPYP